MAIGLIALICGLTAQPTLSETLRIATYNTDLEQKGPGLLLRDIVRGKDPQIRAVLEVLTELRPDIVLLQDIDHDAGLATARALQSALADAGLVLDHVFARPPNTGVPTGLDIDGDGRTGRARDAQGYGLFRGQGGMLILSRHRFDVDAAQDHSKLLWRDLPGARLPVQGDAPFLSQAAQDVLRLSATAHWAVPVITPGGPLWLLAFHATPPVFDGPEDLNGLRNADEIRLWQLYLDGALGLAPKARFVVLGDANLDPERGDGRREALRALLDDPRLTPLAPQGAHGTATVDWSGIGLGQRRVSYLLPSVDLTVIDSGVFWPGPDDPMADTVTRASRHRAVWADIRIPGPD